MKKDRELRRLQREQRRDRVRDLPPEERPHPLPPAVSKAQQRAELEALMGQSFVPIRRPPKWDWTPWREVTTRPDGERYTAVRLGGVMFERDGTLGEDIHSS